MEFKFNATPEELTEAIFLFREAFGVTETKPEPETVYDKAVSNAIKEELAPKKRGGAKRTISREKVKEMHEAGVSNKEIAKKLGASEGTISQIIRKDLNVAKIPLDLAKVRACLAAGRDIEWLVVEFGERYRDEIEEYVKELEAKNEKESNRG